MKYHLIIINLRKHKFDSGMKQSKKFEFHFHKLKGVRYVELFEAGKSLKY